MGFKFMVVCPVCCEEMDEREFKVECTHCGTTIEKVFAGRRDGEEEIKGELEAALRRIKRLEENQIPGRCKDCRYNQIDPKTGFKHCIQKSTDEVRIAVPDSGFCYSFREKDDE